MKGTYFLFDIGGSKIRLAVSKNGRGFSKPVILKTPAKFSDGIKLIVTEAKKLCGEKITTAAGGIAGPLNAKKSMIINAPNMPGWNGKPFKKELQKIVKGPIQLENDTAVVGLGEAIYGAGKGSSIVAYLTVSTGVNGVRIVDRQIVPSALGFEVGQQVIDQGKSLQWNIGGNEIKRRFGKSPEKITDKKIWRDISWSLAVGLNNLIVFWSPDVVVIGGGIMKRISLPKLRKDVKKILRIFPVAPPIKKAALGDVGGLYGALALIRKDNK